MAGSMTGGRTPLDEALRHEGVTMDATAIETYLREASRELLNSALPHDVHRRYGSIRAEQSVVITKLAQEIHDTLSSVGAGEKVLSGKVAQKVKEGISDLVSHAEYTDGVESIRR